MRRELDETKRLHKVELQENEERHAARLHAALGEAERRWRKARSTAESAVTRESELEKEVGSLTGMITALEDTLAAKDELLALRQRSHEAALADATAKFEDTVAQREEEVRSSLENKIRLLTDQVEAQTRAHEAEKQRILAEKQAEMDAALASCQEAMCNMERGGGNASDDKSVEAVLTQMREVRDHS